MNEHELTARDAVRASEEMRGQAQEHMTARAEGEPVRVAPSAPHAELPAAGSVGRGTRDLVDAVEARTTQPAAHGMLFPGSEAETLRHRWSEVQGGFVDEPRRAVERADELVAHVMKRLAEVFAAERAGLEKQWDRGDQVTTEDLRVALQRYRAFFDRLLSM